MNKQMIKIYIAVLDAKNHYFKTPAGNTGSYEKEQVKKEGDKKSC